MFPIIIFMIIVSMNVDSKEVIAVVDSGLNITSEIKPYLCPEHVDLTDTTLGDSSGHGTNIVHLIAKGIDTSKYCIKMFKYSPEKTNVDNYLLALKALLKEKNLKYVNLSLSGYGEDFKEREILTMLDNRGVKLNIAAGNDKERLGYVRCNVYPACYKLSENAHTVGASNTESTNFGPKVKYHEVGFQIKAGGYTLTGSSQATAIHTNKRIRSEE
jgi:hypothetical protein